MTNTPFNRTPPPARSLWRPIGLTLVSTLMLAFSTCAGGFAVGKGPNGIGSFLLYSGLIFIGLFLLTLFFAVVYFLIWVIQKVKSP
jgi:hypothetical protein